MDHSELLNHGIAAVRAGQREQARQLFAQVIRANPRHESAWLWLSTVLDDQKQVTECLERVLALNPANQQAIDRLETLRVVQLLQSEAHASAPNGSEAEVRLGDWLVRQGFVTQKALDKALKTQQQVRRIADREPLGTILLRQGAINADHLAAAIEYQLARTLEHHVGDGVFRQLGYYLVKHGYLAPHQLAQAITRQTLLAQRGKRVKLGELLLNERMLRRDQLDQALRLQKQDYDRQFGTDRDRSW
jgi:tetratricopeptide (TPR) repeat protein